MHGHMVHQLHEFSNTVSSWFVCLQQNQAALLQESVVQEMSTLLYDLVRSCTKYLVLLFRNEIPNTK
jgi:hypothetical protein